jgi:hypothetical protein
MSVFQSPLVTWYTDSQAVCFASKKGHSRNELINSYIQRIQEADAFVSVVWIPSQENVADGPSRRGEMSEITTERKKVDEDDLLWYGRAWRDGGK